MTINGIIREDNKYVIRGRIQYRLSNIEQLRGTLDAVEGDHPVWDFMSHLTELVVSADGDEDIIFRNNANGDNEFLVDALNQYGDKIFKKSPAGREAPLTERYPYGIKESGLKATLQRDGVYGWALTIYAAVAGKDMFSDEPESYAFEILTMNRNQSSNFGDLHE